MDKKDSKLGRKGLEVGKRFRTRFWEGLLGGKLALNPKINPKISHKISSKISQEKNNSSRTAPTDPRRDIINKINKINKNMSNMSKNINKNGAGGGLGSGIGGGLCRTRIWEGESMLFYNIYIISIIIFILSVLLISILSLSLISSQINESNESYGINENNETNPTDETNLSIGINDSITENDSGVDLEVEYNNFDVLEDEFDNLTSELSNSGYDWLTNYNLEYPFVSVFRENSNDEIARFSFISNENWYKVYLTSLGDNESLSTFDLRIFGGEIFGGVEFDYIVDPSLTFMAGTVLVTLNSPVNNSNFNVNNVTFNVTSNATLSWCGVSINTGANVTMDNTTSTAFNYTNTSIADGRYNFTITCNDTAGTYGNSGINNFLIDTIPPTLNVTSPINSSNYNSSSVLFNVSSSEEGTGSIIPDIDNSLVSWWRMDDVNATTGVIDYMGRNNGTAVNAVQTSAGKLGKGMSFDGVLAWLGFNLKETCSSDMAYIDKLGGYCIDKYEASTPGCEIVGNNCANYTSASHCPTICIPTAGVLGGVNSDTGTTAVAYSKENVAPLVGVSQKQARQMCANAGKYLCTSQEWLGAANIKGQVYNLPSNLKDAPYRCVTDSTTYCNYAANSNKACNTSYYSGGKSNCTSSEGVYDMVGNVWEWTNETVDTNKSETCNRAVSGYCYINSTDMSWQTSSTSPIYGNDGTYFLANSSTSVRAVFRGGSWNYGARAGPFCANLINAPSTVNYIIGFRCCSGQG